MTDAASVAAPPLPKVLIVDDLTANLVALKRLLAKADVEVIAASSGNEALALSLDHDFALILLDVQMPDIDGYEVAELLRDADRTRDVPIIFVTAAHKDEHHRLRGYGAGAVDYIEKPIDDVVLLSKVRVFIDLYRSHRELQRLLDLLQKANQGLSMEVENRKRRDAESQMLAGTIFASSAEAIMVCDETNKIVTVNPAFTRITGYEAAEVVGNNPRILHSGLHDPSFYTALWTRLLADGHWQGEIWNRRKNGDIYPEWLSISVVRDETGEISKFVGISSDITIRKAAEEQIKELAFYDPLTRLPNRRLLLDRLKQALAASVRSKREGALLFIDLDNFKMLNDTFGHAEGDLLLQQVSERLARCVREGDTVARLGGDEFMVMLEDLSEIPDEAAAQIKSVGEKILATLTPPYQLPPHEHRCTASIGAALFGEHHASIDDLMKQADIAMYQAKSSGRNTLRFFNPELQLAVKQRADLEESLRIAIKEEQFRLYYQPQIEDDRLVGAEVLIRWQHPERGVVPPGEFIRLAEETGQILALGHWALETACAQMVTWANRREMADLTIAVNVSALQFHQTNFVEQVLAVLAYTGANPQKLKLELTESMLLDNVEDVIAIMTTLRDRGISFSLDDFGTGYSSLSYLKRLPLSQLKIDQSFVRDILTDPNDAAIAHTIVALAHSLRLAVIAEGVETEEQRDFLAKQGCHAYQGYLCSQPLPITEFEQLCFRASRTKGHAMKMVVPRPTNPSVSIPHG
ncbi:EAL domain-containing protein [Telmatospirillum sp.]|uniref:EAL domain-containing response regulator n=1 Tax=Telmatospirillum sp. TaxID=2079197 RepID=UPI00283CED9B|nr:EAL domain-containing protein [Telmatospirillum sp.]MDR3440920.1 EAL domain-containing protein [Telmatospirillum sp.]